MDDDVFAVDFIAYFLAGKDLIDGGSERGRIDINGPGCVEVVRRINEGIATGGIQLCDCLFDRDVVQAQVQRLGGQRHAEGQQQSHQHKGFFHKTGWIRNGFGEDKGFVAKNRDTCKFPCLI
ncbi:MAG: hypothetical protein Q4E27_08860 [Bacteroidales bacterium]|nr:hypothetical protein [Bacteroidales bacterium]